MSRRGKNRSQSTPREEAELDAPAQSTEVEETTARQQSTLPPPPAGVVRYVVAKGRSVTSLRGILASGTEVSARDFSGEGSVESLLKAGVLEEQEA